MKNNMRGGGGFRSTAMRGVMAMVMAKGLTVGSWWNENLIEGADWFVCRFLTGLQSFIGVPSLAFFLPRFPFLYSRVWFNR
jgi:hypothetical protein